MTPACTDADVTLALSRWTAQQPLVTVVLRRRADTAAAHACRPATACGAFPAGTPLHRVLRQLLRHEPPWASARGAAAVDLLEGEEVGRAGRVRVTGCHARRWTCSAAPSSQPLWQLLTPWLRTSPVLRQALAANRDIQLELRGVRLLRLPEDVGAGVRRRRTRGGIPPSRLHDEGSRHRLPGGGP